MKLSEGIIEIDSFIRDKDLLTEQHNDFFNALFSKDLTQDFEQADMAQFYLEYKNHNVFYNDGTLYIFNGKYYVPDEESRIFISDFEGFIRELIDYANKQREEKYPKYIRKLLAFKRANNVRGVLDFVKSKSLLDDKELEGYDYLFNCQNGVLDLQGNEPKLLKHSPKYKITQISNVEYRPELGEVKGEAKDILLSFFMNDETVLNFLFEFLGVALTGYSAIRKFIYAFGSGRNGKSTLFNFLLREIFGSYGAAINYETLTMTRNHSGASGDIVRMLKARLAITNEIKSKLQLNTNLIKTITGGDYYNARLLYKEPKAFAPKCKLVLFGNEQLSIPDSSAGMQDRFVQLPFLNKFDGSVTQEEVWAVLRENKSQILNSIIAGYYRWKAKNAFNIPNSVKEESLRGFASANIFAQFLVENVEREENSQVKLKDVWKRYKNFYKDNDLSDRERLKRTEFENAIRSAGYKLTYDYRNKINLVQNCRLKDENLLF